MSKHENNSPRSKVFLVVYGADGAEVERIERSYYDYYDDFTPLIDESEYRVAHGIRRVVGTIDNDSAIVEQTFDVTYDVDGDIATHRVVFQDGTVVEE